MKPLTKWIATGVVAALLATGAIRTWMARSERQSALNAWQTSQQTAVALELAPSDLASAKTVDLSQGIDISGQIRAVHTVFVKARVPGELQGLTLREGDAVLAGQVVARIDATESQARVQQARQQAVAAKAQVEIAQRSFDNNRALVAQGFISGTALESSQSALNAALANQDAARAGVDLAVKALDDTVLRSPIAGRVSQRLAQPGERVPVDTRVLEITDNRQLEVEANLNPTDAARVQVGQIARLGMDPASLDVTARVVRINPGANAGSRAVPVYLAVSPAVSPDQAGSLRTGVFVVGRLMLGRIHTLAVPLSAVRTDRPQPYVQVVRQSRVEHVTVQTGARGDVAGSTWIAVSGIDEGVTLVDGSVGILRAGTPVHTVGKSQSGQTAQTGAN